MGPLSPSPARKKDEECLLSLAGFLRPQECIDYSDYLHWEGSVITPGHARGVAISGSHAYMPDGYPGLQVIDISDPQSPKIVATANTPGYSEAVAVSGNHTYVADGPAGLQVIDISNPKSPVIVGSIDTATNAKSVAVSGDYAYLVDSEYAGTGLWICHSQCEVPFPFAIKATPDEVTVERGDTLVQDITVANNTYSPRLIQASFAAILPGGRVMPLLGPLPADGYDVGSQSQESRVLNYLVPSDVPAPMDVDFLSILLDYATGDTLDTDQTVVHIVP